MDRYDFIITVYCLVCKRDARIILSLVTFHTSRILTRLKHTQIVIASSQQSRH